MKRTKLFEEKAVDVSRKYSYAFFAIGFFIGGIGWLGYETAAAQMAAVLFVAFGVSLAGDTGPTVLSFEEVRDLLFSELLRQ